MDGLTVLRKTVVQKIVDGGYTQKDVAAKIGITQAMLSQALAGKAQMREERWRIACEMLGVDYDEIMECKPSVAQANNLTEAEAPTVEAQAEPAEGSPLDPRLAHNLEIMCAYTEGKIVEDIRHGGWTVDLDKLRGLLDAVCDLREAISGGK